MTDNLFFAMRECAQLLPPNEEKRVAIFTRYDDGLNIPASTRIIVTVVLEHVPDPEWTPVLDMAAVTV